LWAKVRTQESKPTVKVERGKNGKTVGGMTGKRGLDWGIGNPLPSQGGNAGNPGVYKILRKPGGVKKIEGTGAVAAKANAMLRGALKKA